MALRTKKALDYWAELRRPAGEIAPPGEQAKWEARQALQQRVADATQEDATQEDATQEDATQEDATQEDATQEDATQEDATQEDATQEDATQGWARVRRSRRPLMNAPLAPTPPHRQP